MELKGSRTEQNIREAFKGESQARNRYSFFEEQAKLEGNEEIARMFEKMAGNEMRHAKLWYKLMHGGISESAANIREAAEGENMEWSSMYPEFARTAKEEGFEDIATLFEQVASIERDHEKTFLKAFAAMKSAVAVSEKPAEIVHTESSLVYRCMFCGAVYKQRPDVCSVCGAIGSFEEGIE